MKVEFYGVRGSVPTPMNGTEVLNRVLDSVKKGEDSISVRKLKSLAKKGALGYGGNTSCVFLTHGKDHLVLDGGTGLRALGHRLGQLPLDEPIHLLLTHLHWDHIQGLPFFLPLYQKDRKVIIYSAVGKDALIKSFKDQFVSPYFPVPFEELMSHIEFVGFKGSKTIGPFKVKAQTLVHPDPTYAYRIDAGGKSYAHFSDTELLDLSPSRQEKIREFTKGVDMVVADSQFDDFEDELYKGWGHSCVNAFIDILGGSNVKTLALFHYNPQETEAKVDEIYATAKKYLKKTFPKSKLKLLCAIEGQEHTL